MDKSKQAALMTMRDIAAIAAMQGFLSNGGMVDSRSDADWIAQASLDYADALIARLEEGN